MSIRPAAVPRWLGAAPGLDSISESDLEVAVTGVTLDSRSVLRGDLYAALPGEHTHGARYARQAVESGAAAILTDPAGAEIVGATSIPLVVVPDPRARLGALSAWVYGDPAGDLMMIAITGTNGKTTMSYLIESGLAHLGHQTGIIGTTGVHIGHEELPSERTTPEAPDVHALLAVMRERGVTAVAMEVSSHALALGRVDGIVFDVATFTNLSQDHLDFHGSMDEYFAAKRELFRAERARRAVICVDDDWGTRLAADTDLPASTYGLDPGADWQLVAASVEASGEWAATVVAPGGASAGLSSALPGRFNRANALGAVATLAAVGSPLVEAADGVSACVGVPGRMQAVAAPGFGVYVDYAHTPDAVGRAIAAAREFSDGRILVTLGCGGDRDAGKRPEMGRVASEGADVVIVTDDNPRSEDPAVIRQAVLAGAENGTADVSEIGDRRSAITAIIGMARRGDVVLILGKGHEQGQDVAGVLTPFDDRVVAAEAIGSLQS